MATQNAASTLEIMTNFATNWAGATIQVLDGATVLATHTATSWAASNSGADGVATATLANSGVETIANTGTVDGANLVSGSEVIALTVGVGSGDLNFTTFNYIAGQTSTITSLAVTIPAA